MRASDGQIIAEGETGHVVTDREGRVRSLPESYRALLTAPPQEALAAAQARATAGRVPEGSAPE